MLVKDASECGGSEVQKPHTFEAEKCAEICYGVSTMFAFGTNDYGNPRCNKDGCTCLCETAATSDGTCNIQDNTGYRLYRIYQEYKHLGNTKIISAIVIE